MFQTVAALFGEANLRAMGLATRNTENAVFFFSAGSPVTQAEPLELTLHPKTYYTEGHCNSADGDYATLGYGFEPGLTDLEKRTLTVRLGSSCQISLEGNSANVENGRPDGTDPTEGFEAIMKELGRLDAHKLQLNPFAVEIAEERHADVVPAERAAASAAPRGWRARVEGGAGRLLSFIGGRRGGGGRAPASATAEGDAPPPAYSPPSDDAPPPPYDHSAAGRTSPSR